MRKKLKRFWPALIIICALLPAAAIVYAIGAGGEGDPLISKSYIDEVLLPKIYEYIDGKAAPSGSESAKSFEVISLRAGERIICEAGTEMIVRQGRGRVIASERGGISDVTLGDDLSDNVIAAGNHHLIVPLADGRGIFAEQDMLIMVRGGFQIK